MSLVLPRVIPGISERMVYSLDFPSPGFISSSFLSSRYLTYIEKEMEHMITWIKNYLMKLPNDSLMTVLDIRHPGISLCFLA